MDGLHLLNLWSEFMLAQGRSSGTIRRYRYALVRLFSEVQRDTVAEITEQDIVVFLASLGKKAHSRQLYVQAFRSFFEWAHERRHIGDNPAKHLRPKAPAERVPDAFSVEELGALVEAASRKSRKRGLGILACYALGLRRSEVCGIKPEHIDWTGRRVYIADAKGDKPRWVAMNDIAAEALDALRPWWNGTVLGSLNPQTFTMWVNEAAKEAGLPPNRRRAHMLRASFATHLLDEGVPVQVVSRLLGHSKISTTGRYLAVTEAAPRAAVDRLPRPLEMWRA